MEIALNEAEIEGIRSGKLDAAGLPRNGRSVDLEFNNPQVNDLVERGEDAFIEHPDGRIVREDPNDGGNDPNENEEEPEEAEEEVEEEYFDEDWSFDEEEDIDPEETPINPLYDDEDIPFEVIIEELGGDEEEEEDDDEAEERRREVEEEFLARANAIIAPGSVDELNPITISPFIAPYVRTAHANKIRFDKHGKAGLNQMLKEQNLRALSRHMRAG